MFEFYQGKRVLLTGHTGFKGTWLSQMLNMAGAEVTGYALKAPTEPSLFNLTSMDRLMRSEEGDIRDRDHLMQVFKEVRPQIVFHLAAQPIVRDSYKDPAYTYETNVMGTVNILEAVRRSDCVSSFLNVTTDKVYDNREWEWGYREDDPLDGYDPYSNSKSCSELVTHSYRRSFFSDGSLPISTARAGNVIGGGDFANDRIIPDCVRSAMKSEKIGVRNPHSTRPFQHVLEPLNAYLMIAEKQAEDHSLAGYYNVGPDDSDCVSAKDLVTMFCQSWGEGLSWEYTGNGAGPHEANFLKLDCSRIKKRLGWKPRWNVRTAVDATVEWTRSWMEGEDPRSLMERQILRFYADGEAYNV